MYVKLLQAHQVYTFYDIVGSTNLYDVMRPDALCFTSLLVKGRELPLNVLKDFGIPGEGVIERTDKFNHVNI